jgi:hypothetical protein
MTVTKVALAGYKVVYPSSPADVCAAIANVLA